MAPDATERLNVAKNPLDDTLDRYVALLYHWNRRVRLVGERDAAEFRRNHLAEVLAILPDLAEPAWDMAVDIGSGNGLVAVPLAAAFPARRILALEPRHRKCAFLRQAARELGLANLEIRQEALQAFVPPPELAVLWTARALEIPAGELLHELGKHPGGWLLLFTAEGAPSAGVLRLGAAGLAVVRRREFGGNSRREAVLARISAECST
jgi:16S rRNA (guanine(527)-N(7))-methyltransferase RsmG